MSASSVAVLLLGAAASAQARYEGPWCLHMSIGRSTVIDRCDMPSYEVCRAEMRSFGGSYCTQNPYFWWNRDAMPPRTSRRGRRR